MKKRASYKELYVQPTSVRNFKLHCLVQQYDKHYNDEVYDQEYYDQGRYHYFVDLHLKWTSEYRHKRLIDNDGYAVVVSSVEDLPVVTQETDVLDFAVHI